MTLRTVRTGRNGRNRRTRRPATARLLAAAAGALLLLAPACEVAEEEEPPRPDGGSPSAPSTSPFTGLEREGGPVLAVKLDNAPAARPHTGLESADLVYVEKVEGGISRLMAVFAGEQPESTGPVRSARESDLELLRQFGEPALAYSGVRSALRDDLREAPVKGVPRGTAPSAYFRSPDRAAPHNLFLRPDAALRAVPGASRPHDIGFRFGPAPDGGRKDGRHTVRYDSARFDFAWSAGEKRWLVSMDGSPADTTGGERLGAPTVVVQYVNMPPSRYRDVSGAVTPYIDTVGSGKATVLRDGRAYDVTWKRPAAADGTSFTRPGGSRMPFAPGQVWIVYAER